MMKASFSLPWRMLLAIGSSLLILGLVFHIISRGNNTISPAQILEMLRQLSMTPALASLACLAAQTILRAQRYLLLLRADGHARPPNFFPILLATAARNMFIDLLPARIGELSYVALLNRGCGVAAGACVSSMALSVFLDFAALLLLVLALAAWFLIAAELPSWLIMALVGLAILIAVTGVLLFWGVRHGAAWFQRSFPGLSSMRPINWSLKFANELADSLRRAKQTGVLAKALALSLWVRCFKYAGFYLLFLAVTATSLPAMADAPPFEAITALLSAEAAAAMPVPAFMSFGAYETGGLLCLAALGYAAVDSTMAMLAIHIASQIMDYALGGLALALFFMLPAVCAGSDKKATSQRNNRIVSRALSFISIAALLMTAFFAAFETLRMRKLGSLSAPPAGQAANPDLSEIQKTMAAITHLKGFVVWSSNRGGNHDIWKMTLPQMTLSALTKHPHAEYFPRLSPDGRKLAFCRSKTPWVSQRDPLAWDVWILNMDTGNENKIAENAVAPSWSRDGLRLYFQSQGVKCVEHDLFSGKEKTLFEAGKPPVPQGALLETPSVNSKSGIMAATLRGSCRELALFEPTGKMIHLGDRGKGCQLFWAPDESFLYFVTSHGGNKKNRFMRFDPETRIASEWFDMPGAWSHEYFPKLSENGKWLVFGACSEGHEHDTADYEIFLWQVGNPHEQPARLTWHTGNDNWPDIFVE